MLAGAWRGKNSVCTVRRAGLLRPSRVGFWTSPIPIVAQAKGRAGSGAPWNPRPFEENAPPGAFPPKDTSCIHGRWRASMPAEEKEAREHWRVLAPGYVLYPGASGRASMPARRCARQGALSWR